WDSSFVPNSPVYGMGCGGSVLLMQIAAFCRRRSLGVVVSLATACAAPPLAAQGMQTIDPNAAIDGDLAQPQPVAPPATVYDGVTPGPGPHPSSPQPVAPACPQPAPAPAAAPPVAAQTDAWKEDDLIGAAEGVFGKGAKGLAGLIEDVLKKQGEPNGYIVGRE